MAVADALVLQDSVGILQTRKESAPAAERGPAPQNQQTLARLDIMSTGGSTFSAGLESVFVSEGGAKRSRLGAKSRYLPLEKEGTDWPFDSIALPAPLE